jgi:hypothetical protein
MVSFGSALGDVSALLSTIFTGGLLLVAVVAAVVAWLTLRGGRRDVATQIAAQLESDRRRRVYALADRTTQLEFVIESTGALQLFGLEDDTLATWWRDRPHDPQKELISQQAVVLLNFCEEIASEYLDDLLDKEIADKNIGYIAAQTWSAAQPFVEFLRRESREERAWERLQTFATAWTPPEPERSDAGTNQGAA